MPRPQIIRADTIDLQDQHAPSAKDHGSHGARNGSSHHNQSLRHAEQQTKGDLSTSPRVSLDHFDDDDEHSQIDIAYDETEDLVAELSGSRDGENGHYESGGDGNMDGDEDDDLLDDDMMDKISSSPSIDDEDIDFEFVYALHTFVATVEGQANASKGDTMVLLDDSNSYWWLVRVVKDGSIGYLPAEHIETPTERLARLNKHRNVDLSSMMLGDNPEKSKNPLKKAMRRRNAKTVTFASPTFFEASDIDYSTEEEEEEEEGEGEEAAEEEEARRAETETIHDEIHDEDIVVEPLKPKSNKEKAPKVDAEEIQADRSSFEKPRPSDESLDRPGDNVSRSRNGTLRNTDSFFKDDTAEPKKISLTPNLLRDDSGNSVVKTEPQEGRVSLESLEKSLSSGEKSKRKDKKPGMLSGLFKRKDKKGRTSEDDGDESEKTPEELSPISTQSKMSSESLRDAGNAKPQTMQRQTSKLQKQPPADLVAATQQPRTSQDMPSSIPSSPVKEDHGPSIRRVISPSGTGVVAPLQLRSSHETNSSPFEQRTQGSETSSPAKPSSLASSPKQWQSTLYEDEDEVDEMVPVKHSPQLQQQSTQPSQQPAQSPPQQKPPQPQPLQLQQQPNGTRENRRSLSESPVDVSPTRIQPPELTVDTSSPEERSVSPLSSERSSPELIDAAEGKADEATPVSTVSSTATATWSDSGLRSYLEDGSDIKDLLIIVHDNSNVQPAGPDHPITGSLFKHESKRLKEMTGQLDDLLSGWVTRKSDRRPNNRI